MHRHRKHLHPRRRPQRRRVSEAQVIRLLRNADRLRHYDHNTETKFTPLQVRRMDEGAQVGRVLIHGLGWEGPAYQWRCFPCRRPGRGFLRGKRVQNPGTAVKGAVEHNVEKHPNFNGALVDDWDWDKR